MGSENTKVLAIDDNKEILYAISAICEYQNWTAYTALNGEIGVQEFMKHRPHIVLVDYNMPIYDGIETVKKIRFISKNVPIIVLTVEERQEIADKFMKAGASDFALKPIKTIDLIARIKVHLRLSSTVDYMMDDEDEEYIKGITRATLDLIAQDLEREGNYTTISEIAERTDLAYQTVHRYVQYLIENKKVKVTYDYGKRGRPTQKFRWIRK